MRRFSLVVVVLAVLLGIYAALGYLLVPGLAQRELVAQLEARLGCPARFASMRFDPFRFVAEARGVQLCPAASGAGLVGARAVRLDFDPFSSFFGRGYVFGDLAIDGLALQLERGADRRWNVQPVLERLQQPAAAKAAPEDKTSKGGTQVSLKQVTLNDASLTLMERSGPKPATIRIAPLNLKASHLGTQGEGQASLEGTIEGGGTLQASGTFNASPVAARGNARLTAVPLALPWPFLADETSLAPPGGALSAALDYDYAADRGFRASKIEAAASEVHLQLADDPEPLGTAKTLRLSGGAIDTAARSLQVGELALEAGKLRFAKDRRGVNWGRMARASEEKPPAQPGSKPFMVHLAQVKLDGVDVSWADAERERPYEMRFGALNGAGILDLALGGEKTEVKLTETRLASSPATLTTGDDRANRTRGATNGATKGEQDVTLQRIELSGGSLDLAAQHIALARFAIDGGQVHALRESNGRFTLARAFASDKPAEGKPWKVEIGEAEASALALDYIDETFRPALRYPVTLTASVRDFGREGQPLVADLLAQAGKGTLAASASADAKFDDVVASVRANGIDLAPLQPIVGQVARVRVAAGTASSEAKLAWRGGVLGIDASAAIDGLALDDERGEARVLSWKKLSAGSVRYRSKPAGLEVDEVVLEGPQTRIAIDQGHELNLTRLVRERPATRQGQGEVEAAKAQSLPVHVGSVQVREGTVEYADATLIFPFQTRVEQLSGFVTGLSSDRGRPAQIDLAGRVQPFGEGRVQGSIEAFAPREFADLRLNFENVPLPTLSPYSATFLGRTLAAGRLWLDLGYQIKHGELNGNNRISVRDLRLGERVNAPGALDLPLDLAVALLTDKDGVLTTDLQVSGNLDDPKFNVAGLVKAALGNLVSRVVTAPFRALGRLFGLGSDKEEQVAIEFQPGSARISAPNEERLVNLARALAERPQLTLHVSAPYDPARDTAALREQSARARLAAALGRPDQPQGIDIESEPSRNAMRGMLANVAPKPAPPTTLEPASAAGTGSSQPAGSTGQDLFRQLVDAQDVGDAQVRELAARRAQGIIDFLKAKGVEPGRLASGEILEERDEKKPIAAPLALGAVKAG